MVSLIISFFSLCNAANLPPGFAEVQVASGLNPTAMALSPDGRIFIAQKNGIVSIVENGKMLEDPLMVIDVDNENERGLCGIAIDPEFAQNGYVYLYYTVKDENHNRVSRFTTDGNSVLPASELILLELDQLYGTVHNGGAMVFGIDGKLYISTGDGTSHITSQDMATLLGKMLRINADGSIPDDNPFYLTLADQYRAIYALGFRNSFSMTVQPGTGRIFATEVGGVAWEEVNEILPGRNYGWPIIEGPISTQTPPDNYMEPVFIYTHADGCAAVGAAFYNPVNEIFPQQYVGKFFFADYCSGYIKYMDPDIPFVAQTFANNINRPLNLIVAPDGTLYYLARAGIGGGSVEDNTGTDNGTLWRVFYTGSGAPFVSVNPESILISEGEDAEFTMGVSGTQPIMYQWQRNEIDIQDGNASSYLLQQAMLSDSGSLFRCIVSNLDGADTTDVAELRVTASQRPDPEILTPLEGEFYRAGDLLAFSGRAIDNEEGELDPTALRWKIDFHHDTHTHPALVTTAGITEGTYFIPQVGETADNVWYRISLTATDASGLSRTTTREIFPLKTIFHVHSIPSGLPVYVESNFVQTPVSTPSVVGIARRIEVLPSVFVGDSVFLFKEWSDGETSPARTFAALDDTITYTAVYESYPLGDGTGVRGYYFDGPAFDPTFYEPHLFSRIDTTIDFNWEEGTPSPLMGDDYWLVRWEGVVETLFDDTYNFHVIADDGMRLWVDSQLIIDAWIPQPPTEWTGTIALQGGKEYSIKLEFFEEAGGALCQLFWSSGRFAKSIIPKRQLRPEMSSGTIDPTTFSINVYPNPANDMLMIEVPDEYVDGLVIEIINILGQTSIGRTETLPSGPLQLDVSHLAAGLYVIKCMTQRGEMAVVEFVKN